MFWTGLSGSALALASAVVYGSGDFFGGLASRRLHPFQVLTISSFVGFFVMLGLAVVRGETWPSVEDLIWAGLAGSLGMLGLAALYRGLAMGESAIVSPTSGVVGAALPVLVGIITQGFPSSIQLAGFAVAIPGIWLVTKQPDASRQKDPHRFLAGLPGRSRLWAVLCLDRASRPPCNLCSVGFSQVGRIDPGGSRLFYQTPHVALPSYQFQGCLDSCIGGVVRSTGKRSLPGCYPAGPVGCGGCSDFAFSSSDCAAFLGCPQRKNFNAAVAGCDVLPAGDCLDYSIISIRRGKWPTPQLF